ncbi:MAG: RidA family protein [Gemmatimonadaceae bacterium]
MSDDPRAWQPVMLPDPYPPPAGAYSPAVRAGDLLFISGQVPRDLVSGALAGADLASQTRQVLENLRVTLGAAGARIDDVIAVTVFLANTDDWTEFNSIYKSLLTPPYPSRTVVGAQLRGILIEINAVAKVN